MPGKANKDIQAVCKTCDLRCYWVECPTGGWWSHRRHPANDHDADPGWQPEQFINDSGEYITVMPVNRLYR